MCKKKKVENQKWPKRKVLKGENEYNMQNEIKRTIQDTSNILMICIRRPFSFLATGAIITGS